MAKVVVVKFKNTCKPYFFEKGDRDYVRGQGVIVETAHGLEYGVVTNPCHEVEEEKLVAPLKPIVRVATEKDKETVKKNEERRASAMAVCREKIAAHGLEMKLIDCEFTFDGNKAVFTFSAEGRVDFRELVKDLAGHFHLRIELKQVGIRDETRILGGIAPCGRECCCAGCMPDFKKVSIKMAKNQGLSLNPGKISGLCGRLMCCLSYENEYYAAVYKKMPKYGATVDTPEGRGVVVSTNMLKMEMRVKIEKDGALLYRDFPAETLGYKVGSPQQEEDGDEGEEEVPPVEEGEKEPSKEHEQPSHPKQKNNQKGQGGQNNQGNQNKQQQKNHNHHGKFNKKKGGGKGNGGKKPE